MIAVTLFFIALGILMLAAALMHWDWMYGFLEIEIIENILGENAARWAFGIMGVAVVVATIVIWAQSR